MINEPKGDLTIQVLAMPKDANPGGDIFGGWLVSQMDIAGGLFCQRLAKGRVVTVAINSMTFKQPVFVGDLLCCFVHLKKKGRTSMVIHVDAYVRRRFEPEEQIKVTEGIFTFVKIDENRKPSPL